MKQTVQKYYLQQTQTCSKHIFNFNIVLTKKLFLFLLKKVMFSLNKNYLYTV